MKRKKDRTVFLQYKCKDGSTTVANTASVGLLHWYGRIVPTKPIENPRPFTVYVVSTRMPSPYDPLFLPLVVAGLERNYGKSPPIPEHLLEAAHYSTLNDLDFRDVEKHLKKGTPVIVEYESVCLEILRWLQELGEITDMIFDKPLQPLGW